MWFSLFDMMNSRNLLAKNYKVPITLHNIEERREFVALAETYIAGLMDRVGGTPPLQTNRKTGFLGFIISGHSMIGIFDEINRLQCTERPFLMTYKVSQDHIELLFSVIRSKGGFNNNPTARQFKAAYKRLLVHHELRSIGSGNCLALDFTSILHTSGLQKREQIVVDPLETRKSSPETHLLSIEENDELADDEDLTSVPDLSRLSPFVDDIVIYVAGFVCFQLKKTVKCMSCILALLFDYEASESNLLNRKSYGGLSQPPNDVVLLCRRAESCLRAEQGNSNIMKRKNVLQYLTCAVLSSVAGTDVFACLNSHVFDQTAEYNHIIMLMKAVISQYIKIRLHHIAFLHNESQAKRRVRHKLTKLILFNHE